MILLVDEWDVDYENRDSMLWSNASDELLRQIAKNIILKNAI